MEIGNPLVIKNFTKKYGNYNAVENLSLSLHFGEVFGFLGPNGSGKSTTIRTIMNFIQPTLGSITVHGFDSVKDDVQIKNNIGYIAGEIALYNSLTGYQVINYLANLGRTVDNRFVSQLSGKLQAELDQHIGKLSKGNRQKLGLILACMHKPKLLILDEPTSGLDPLIKQAFYDLVLEMKQNGTTIFLSSHDFAEVEKICDRVGFIREGRLITIQDIQDILDVNIRKYRIVFRNAPNIADFESVQGISDLKLNDRILTLTISGNIENFIHHLGKYSVIDLHEQETTLEDIFLQFYEK
ncbi:MAG: ABC transporter [Chloroflexi bacterium]|nr:ABC transporter [Chloroflexota bacterium]|tara:strand:+ start:47 stop:937 length:891 start_codon:yes stop_codon:yes gene_type:complete